MKIFKILLEIKRTIWCELPNEYSGIYLYAFPSIVFLY